MVHFLELVEWEEYDMLLSPVGRFKFSFPFPTSSSVTKENNFWAQLLSPEGLGSVGHFFSSVILFLISLIYLHFINVTSTLTFHKYPHAYSQFASSGLDAKACLLSPLIWPCPSGFKSKMAFFTSLHSVCFMCLQVLTFLPSIHQGSEIGHLWVNLHDCQLQSIIIRGQDLSLRIPSFEEIINWTFTIPASYSPTGTRSLTYSELSTYSCNENAPNLML